MNIKPMKKQIYPKGLVIRTGVRTNGRMRIPQSKSTLSIRNIGPALPCASSIDRSLIYTMLPEVRYHRRGVVDALQGRQALRPAIQQ
jgi:hypothetical protein